MIGNHCKSGEHEEAGLKLSLKRGRSQQRTFYCLSLTLLYIERDRRKWKLTFVCNRYIGFYEAKRRLRISWQLKSERDNMRKVITYGTFDLFHYGHVHLLRRARELGDYLIVALSSDDFNELAKVKVTYFTYEQRKLILEAIRYVDEIIPEESGSRTDDIKKYGISTLLSVRGAANLISQEEGCEVVYLERTPEVSSSAIKADHGAELKRGGL